MDYPLPSLSQSGSVDPSQSSGKTGHGGLEHVSLSEESPSQRLLNNSVLIFDLVLVRVPDPQLALQSDQLSQLPHSHA